jgi:hypothetical protein
VTPGDVLTTPLSPRPRTPDATDRLIDALRFYRENPVKYVEHIIFRGVDPDPARRRRATVEPHQADMLDLIAEHDRVAIAAANGVGKDAMTAWAIEWYLVTHYRARIPVVSPTGRQVKRTIFAEIALWTKESLAFPKLQLLLTNELRHRAAPSEWAAFGFAPTITADDPTGAIEGVHAEFLLFVITEAKAVEKAVWDAAQRMCTRPGNKMFAQSVPGPEAGEFFHCFTMRARTWKTFSFPSAALDDAGGRYTPTTRLVSQASVDEKLLEGVDSANFRAGVLALFLRQGATNLIALSDIVAAMSPERHGALAAQAATATVELGVDVARFGDDMTTLAARRGPIVLPVEAHGDLDEMAVAGVVADAIRRHRARVVRFDNTGGYGAGAYDRLLELQRETEPDPNKPGTTRRKHAHLQDVRIIGVNVATKPTDDTKWVNTRDELWDRTADRFARGEVACADDPLLREELSTVNYAFTSAGQKKIEPKDKHKARLGRSPDRADALCLAFGGTELPPPASARIDATRETYHAPRPSVALGVARPLAPLWRRR